MRPYVIRQGDYLTRLAHDLGFDADAVWNHGDNREVRDRSEREILAPGDVLRVPEPARDEHDLRANTTNTYRARVPWVRISIALADEAGALANARCVIEGISARTEEHQTDGDGVLSFRVPLTVREVRVSVPALHLSFPVGIAHLDPMTTPSGVRTRLRHLGYYRAAPSARSDERWDEPALVAAITLFQRAQRLDPTGVMNDDTRDALRRVHGS